VPPFGFTLEEDKLDLLEKTGIKKLPFHSGSFFEGQFNLTYSRLSSCSIGSWGGGACSAGLHPINKVPNKSGIANKSSSFFITILLVI